MNIFIYNPYWSSLGGGEKYVTILGESLSKNGFNVFFLYKEKYFSKEKLEKYFNADLSKIGTTFVGNVSSLKTLSKKCDVLIALTNFRTVPSEAKKTIFILQTPYGKISTATIARKLLLGKAKESAKDFFRMNLLKRSKNISRVVVYSKYVHDALLHHHSVESFVLAPPIDDFFVEGIQKEKIVLSVGRIFAGLYNQKRYDVTTKIFRELSIKELKDWEYHIIGSVANDNATKKMLEQLHKENLGFPIFFHLNEPYAKLKEWYNRASIFWHAAGYGVDEENFPERTEHFGMSTVEAMSAYAVPVVMNNGGQKEIVLENENGFLWNTLGELTEKTIRIANDEKLRKTIAGKARERFYFYSREEFANNVRRLFIELT